MKSLKLLRTRSRLGRTYRFIYTALPPKNSLSEMQKSGTFTRAELLTFRFRAPGAMRSWQKAWVKSIVGCRIQAGRPSISAKKRM